MMKRHSRKVFFVVGVSLLVAGLAFRFRPMESNEARACRQVSNYWSDLGLPKRNASEQQISEAFRRNQVAFGGWLTDLNCTAQISVTGKVMKFFAAAKPQETGALAVVIKGFVRSQSNFRNDVQASSMGKLFTDRAVSGYFTESIIDDWETKVGAGEVSLAAALKEIVSSKVLMKDLDVFERLLVEVPRRPVPTSNKDKCTYAASQWERLGFPDLNDSSEEFSAKLKDEVVLKNLDDWIVMLSCSNPGAVGRVVYSLVKSEPQDLPRLALLTLQLARTTSDATQQKQAEALVAVFSADEVQQAYKPAIVEKAAERIRTGKLVFQKAFIEIIEPSIHADTRDDFLLLVDLSTVA